MTARFDELRSARATLEDWCAFAEHLEDAVRSRQALLMSMRSESSMREGGLLEPTTDDPHATIDAVTTDFRALDALRRKVLGTLAVLRAEITRELEPVRN
jgi:hypothetical protein